MNYIIITPAYNEEKYIGETIESVLKQTVKPLAWIIVDDDSTDKTAEVIKGYADRNPWITYVYRKKEQGQTYYASNVHAIDEALKTAREYDYEYLAILDADITLPENYYHDIQAIFSQDKKLGIVSGNCADKIGDELKMHLYDRRSCAKAVMVFKRECFEDIDGFIPMKYGGEDTCACFMARMKKWKTWAYYELIVIHNKPLGTGPSSNMLKIRFRQGVGEYFMGSHPVFVCIKSLRRCFKESPYIIGGLMRFMGFLYGHLKNEKRQISKDLVKFIRKEQIGRILKRNKIPEEFQVDIQYEKP